MGERTSAALLSLGGALLVAFALTLSTATAHADSSQPTASLTAAQRSALLAGHTVTFPLEFQRDGGQYTGGVAYQVMNAEPEAVLAALSTPRALLDALPKTRRAKLVDRAGDVARIELNQGTPVVNATYTVRLVRRPGEVRFRLDPTRPHGIRDVWGYFRVSSLSRGRSLVTVAVALDVGSGPVRWFFEDRVQRVVLDAPRTIRNYVERRARTRRRVLAHRTR